MKQRLGVASALMGDPELIVLDEPTNGLDPAGMQDMRGLVVSLARGGQTVLLSSHLLAEVQDICDRVGVINDGRLFASRPSPSCAARRPLRVRATPRTERWRWPSGWPVTTAPDARGPDRSRPAGGGRPDAGARWWRRGSTCTRSPRRTQPRRGLLRDDDATRPHNQGRGERAMRRPDPTAAGPNCCACAGGPPSG